MIWERIHCWRVGLTMVSIYSIRKPANSSPGPDLWNSILVAKMYKGQGVFF
jgi:hypothetical protein